MFCKNVYCIHNSQFKVGVLLGKIWFMFPSKQAFKTFSKVGKKKLEVGEMGWGGDLCALV